MGRNIVASVPDGGKDLHRANSAPRQRHAEMVVHVVERVINLASADAVALRDDETVLLLFSDRLTKFQCDTLRDHLLRSLDFSAPAAAVFIPAGQVEQMMVAPYANPAPVHSFPAPRSPSCIMAPAAYRTK